jgi:hypothetical protein
MAFVKHMNLSKNQSHGITSAPLRRDHPGCRSDMKPAPVSAEGVITCTAGGAVISERVGLVENDD